MHAPQYSVLRFMQFRTPSPGNGANHTEDGLPTSTNRIKIIYTGVICWVESGFCAVDT